MSTAYFLFAALLLGAVASQTCPNEAIKESEYFSGVPFRFVANSGDSFNLCPRFNGKPSCCPGDIQSAAEAAFLVGRARILLAKVQVSIAKARANADLAVFSEMQKEVDNAFQRNELTQQQYNALTNLITNVKNAFSTFIDAASSSFIKCLESILTYLAGSLCLACDPESEKYVLVNGDNVTLIISEATCDAMNGGCIDFYLVYVRLAVDLYNAVAEFDRELGGDASDANVTASWPQQCGWTQNTTDGFECKEYICTKMLQGTNAGAPDISGSSRPAIVAVDSRVRSLVRSLRPLHESPVANHVSHMSALHADVVQRRAATQYTAVSADGADLYALGQESTLDTSADSGSSPAGALGWMIAELV